MEKILVIQAARFGDLIQTRRLLLSLKSAEVHLAVDAALAPLAKLLYPFTLVHALRLHGQYSAEAAYENEKVFFALALAKYDLVYNLNFSPLTSAICRLFEPESIIGYRPARSSRGGLLRSPWARLGFGLSAMRNAATLNLADFWAHFCNRAIRPDIVNPVAKAGGGGLGIAVAGREDRRSLPPEALAVAAKTCFSLLNAPIIKIFGTANEAGRAKKAMRFFSAPMLAKTINLCGQTDWPTLVADVSGLDLLLTPDTGLMHLAAFLGAPVLACFFSSAWAHETGPYGLGHTIIQAAPPCAPCLESARCAKSLLCHQPFLSESFSRVIAQALGKAPLQNWPENLQLWQTALDNLGTKLTLVAGNDSLAKLRAEIRNFVQTNCGLALPEPDAAPAWAKLLQPGQWMLPPWRYC